MFNGYSQDLRVDSIPPGAKALVSYSSEVYTTPVSIELPRGESYVLYVWDESGQIHDVQLNDNTDRVGLPISSLTGVAWIDRTIGWTVHVLLLPGYMIDNALGTNRGFKPDRVLVHLETGAIWAEDGDPPDGWPPPEASAAP